MVKSAFHDLFPADQAEDLEMRSVLLRGLSKWLEAGEMTEAEAAKRLGTTQARVSEIKNGKIAHFSLDMLVKLARRAGLHPRIELDIAA